MAKRKKETTMQDIADRLGISKNAVSLALGDRPGVSAELRGRVKKLARQLNYQGLENQAPTAFKNQNIMVIAPDYISHDTRYYYKLFWAIEKQAKYCKFNTVISSVSKEMEQVGQLPPLFHEFPFKGIIIIGVFSAAYLQRLLELGLPLIMADTYLPDLPIPAVVAANMEDMYSLVEYLCRQGLRDIGFVGPVNSTSSFFDRWRGYASAMAYHHLPIRPEHCLLEMHTLEHLGEQQEIERVTSELKSLPEAFVCANDVIAAAVMRTFLAQGLQVPGEISVVGFDDIDAAALLAPPLTTVRVQRELIGSTTVDLLLQQIERAEPFNDRLVVSVFGELVIRESARQAE